MCRIFVLILLLSMPLVSYAQEEKVLVQDSIYSVVEQMPSFPGGDFEMMKYIGKHLYFADSILYLGVQGRVVIDGYIDTDGYLKGLKIKRGMHPVIDSAYYKVLKRMPQWNVGKHDGKSVRVYQRFQFLPHLK